MVDRFIDSRPVHLVIKTLLLNEDQSIQEFYFYKIQSVLFHVKLALEAKLSLQLAYQ